MPIHLGHTRSSCQRDHMLLTPDTFVRSPLPRMQNATAIVHVGGPAIGASFTWYTVEMAAGGSMETLELLQTFLWVLEGSVEIGGHPLGERQYAYAPAGSITQIFSERPARILVIRKPYTKLETLAPAALVGDERNITPQPLQGDEALAVRALLPADLSFDFAVNTMTYQPGASLPMVESHVMEHGLLMLEGEGIYRLNDSWYPVTAGDFIYMAPYCPQWFGALGKKPAKYIIYKDWNRHPFSL
jgi:(S)-ureidoglycine aminohydrolase